MKKLYILLCFILFLSGCNMNSHDIPIDSSESSSNSEFNVLGEYICSGEYFNNQFFVQNPKCIPSVTFYDNGSCKFAVNYLDGVCDVGGVYKVKNNYVNVELNLSNTIFEEDGTNYMDNKYGFYILSNNQIKIDRSFYCVEAEDVFIKMEQ